MISVIAILCLFAIAIVHELLSTGDPILAAFLILWLAALAWNGYWFLFRVTYEIGVAEGTTLRWRTVATAHEAPLASVRNVRSPYGPFSGGLLRINIDGHLSPLLMTSPGFEGVVEMIGGLRPDLSIRTSWLDRAVGRSGIPGVAWQKIGEARP